jgi:hypothetical protein
MSSRSKATSLFDYLVGAGEQHGRHLDAERTGGRQIDDEFKLGRLHDRRIGGLGALEDASGIAAEQLINLGQARSMAHQAASFRIVAAVVDGGYAMARCQRRQLEAAAVIDRVGTDNERVSAVVKPALRRLLRFGGCRLPLPRPERHGLTPRLSPPASSPRHWYCWG